MRSFLQMLALVLIAVELKAAPAPEKLPRRFIELLPYVQISPDQEEANTCWFMASTGAMELLLNKKNNIKNPKKGGKYDLAELFLYHQKDYEGDEVEHFIQDIVLRFNYGEAIHESKWPFQASVEEDQGEGLPPKKVPNKAIWNEPENFETLPRIKVPKIKSSLLFAKGGKWATEVLEEEDILAMKKALVKTKSPLIVNYNDEDFWHVVLIVGYDDTKVNKKDNCYELEKEECNKRGAFYVRDSNGKKFERRAYNWFLKKGNAAATVELKKKN